MNMMNPGNTDYLDLEEFAGLLPLADPSIALDFLLTTKNAVRNCAIALTECASPDVRVAVRTQLDQAIDMHDKISQLMIKKGWLHPYNLNEQYPIDIQSAQMVMKVANLNLFPEMPPANSPGNTGTKEANEL